jgi:hypothetical protein
MSYNDTTAFLQSQATAALVEAKNNAGRLYSLPPQVTLREPNFNVNLNKPDIGPPPNFGDLFQGGDSTDPTIKYLNEQSDIWIQKYFPSISACLRNIPDDWLCGVISGVKPFGIDKTVFELVWHNARDRAYRTRNTEVRTLEADFSSRGFSLPPGAMVDAITAAEQRATDSIMDVNVQQAIKDADIKNELLQFAVQQSITYKLGIMNSLADFYKTWVTLPDKDIERARIKAQAMSALYSALAAYYNIEITFEELQLRAAQADAGIDIDVDRNRLTKQNNSGMAASGLGTAVSSFARVAESALAGSSSLTAEIASI